MANPLSSKPRRKCTRDLMAIALNWSEIEGRTDEFRRLDDLREIAADQHDIAATERDALPQKKKKKKSTAMGFMCPTTLPVMRTGWPGRFVGEAARSPDRTHRLPSRPRPLQRIDGLGIGDGGDQHVRADPVRSISFRIQVAVSRPIAVVGQHDGSLTARDGLLGKPDTFGNRCEPWSSVEQRFAAAPRPGRQIVGGFCASVALPLVMTWKVRPTSGTSAKGNPKKTFT